MRNLNDVFHTRCCSQRLDLRTTTTIADSANHSAFGAFDHVSLKTAFSDAIYHMVYLFFRCLCRHVNEHDWFSFSFLSFRRLPLQRLRRMQAQRSVCKFSDRLECQSSQPSLQQ